jgi:hypothetical protein
MDTLIWVSIFVLMVLWLVVIASYYRTTKGGGG